MEREKKTKQMLVSDLQAFGIKLNEREKRN